MPEFNKSCGSVLTETTGWLASPDSDNDGLYDNNEDCWWFIIADFYQAITINITDIDIEDNVVCGYDYLKVNRTQLCFNYVTCWERADILALVCGV